jgi:hypothetical protein
MLEELRIPLEKLEEALAKDKPAAYDADEEVADRMAGHGAAFQQQKDVDHAAGHDSEEGRRNMPVLVACVAASFAFSNSS